MGVFFGIIVTLLVLVAAFSLYMSMRELNSAKPRKKTWADEWRETAELARKHDLRMPNNYYEEIAHKRELSWSGQKITGYTRGSTAHYNLSRGLSNAGQWVPVGDVEVRINLADPPGLFHFRQHRNFAKKPLARTRTQWSSEYKAYRTASDHAAHEAAERAREQRELLRTSDHPIIDVERWGRP